MKLLILDTSFQAVDAIDTFESFIWTDRYAECGEFEIVTSCNLRELALYQQDYYIWSESSEHLMIIEDIEISSDVEDGSKLTITGRSLESILERRIIWGQTILTGNLQNGIKTLLNNNVINCSDADRRIPNFIFEDSDDPYITELTIDAQYANENLYDTIKDLCADAKIGFSVTINDSYQFVFKLYFGEDRSYDQEDNDYVIFSHRFENIINSNYMNSKKTLKNVCLVGGEGEGSDKKYATVGSGTGMERRELFVEASDISSKNGETEIPAATYTAQLQQRGKEELAANKLTRNFEGEVEPNMSFTYGVDYFVGDIVQVENEYGVSYRSRITEFVHSIDDTGYSTYPTFTSVEEDE